MKRAPGRFFKWWQVSCATCGKASPLFSAPTLAKAEKALRATARPGSRWVKRAGLWLCRRCSKNGGAL